MRQARVEIEDGYIKNLDSDAGIWVVTTEGLIMRHCDMQWVNLIGFKSLSGYGEVTDIIGDA